MPTMYHHIANKIFTFKSRRVQSPGSKTPKERFEACVTGLAEVPDLEIRIGGYRWHVHSKIVSMRSKFFQVLCGGQFMEAHSRVVNLHDDDLWTVASVIRWFYVGTTTVLDWDESWCEVASLEQMLEHGAALPDYQQLKWKNEQRFEWERVVEHYYVADKYDIPELRSNCYQVLSSYIENNLGLLEDIMDYVGTIVLQGDKQLLTSLLEPTFRKYDDLSPTCTMVARFFDNDAEIMSLLVKLLCKEADNRRQNEKEEVAPFELGS